MKRLAAACLVCAFGCAARAPSLVGGAAGNEGNADAAAGATGAEDSAGAPPATSGAADGAAGAGGRASDDAGSGAARHDAATEDVAAVMDVRADLSPELPIGEADAGGALPLGCAGATFALCDDFESGAVDPKLWKAAQNKGAVTLDATRGARGSQRSVHVHVDSGGDTMVGLVEAKTFPALAKKLFARAFVYIPGASATSLFTGDRHSRLIYAQGTNPYGEYALGIWNGGLIQNHYSKTDDSQDTKMLPPFDQWFCLEYELDAAAGNVRAYLNDVEIAALRHDGWPATNVASLMFGIDRYGSFSVAEDIWFDDVAVDGARIGCAR
jgi:hypothetical protein